MEQCLEGRTVLVTGASDGIGKEAALTYAQAGAQVLLLGRNQSALNEVYDQIEQAGYPQAAVVPFDLNTDDETAYQALAEQIQEHFGHLDGLLLNAGILGSKTSISHYQWQDWQEVMQVNVNSQFLMVKHLLPLLEAAPADASVILTTSSVGRQGRAFWGAYSVSKFAIEGLAQILAQELENTSRVRVNCINPGATRTKMRAQAYPAENPENLLEATDIMPLYLHLMSAASIGTQGQSLDAQPPVAPETRR